MALVAPVRLGSGRRRDVVGLSRREQFAVMAFAPMAHQDEPCAGRARTTQKLAHEGIDNVGAFEFVELPVTC